MHTCMWVCVPMWTKGWGVGGNRMFCSVTACHIPLWQSLPEPGARPGSQPQRSSCPPYQWGYKGIWEQCLHFFLSGYWMFELRSSCSQLFFLFSSRLNKLLLLRTTQKTFPALVGKWSVFNCTTLPLAPSWTQPQTTDKEVGLCATIFYLPIFGYPRLFLCCALFKPFRQSV